MLLSSLVMLLLAIAIFLLVQRFHNDDVMQLAIFLVAMLLLLGSLVLTPWPLKLSILCVVLARLHWAQDPNPF